MDTTTRPTNPGTYGAILGMVAGGLLALASVVMLFGTWNLGLMVGTGSRGTAALGLILGAAAIFFGWRVLSYRHDAVRHAAIFSSALALFGVVTLVAGATAATVVLLALHAGAAILLWTRHVAETSGRMTAR